MNEPETRPKTWSVGDLAASCRVTVRTLHHYDQVGLVTASDRTPAGHRRYSESDVRRLYRVLALRQLGLRLEEIAQWLDADSDLVVLVSQHLDAVDGEVRRHQQLRDRLARILNALERTGRTTADDFIGAMQEMAMHDDHLTPEQRTRLDNDRSQLGYSGIDRWRVDAEEAVSALRTAFEEEVDPADPYVQDLVHRIRQLRRQFTGDDPDIGLALRHVHGDPSWDATRALVPQEPQLRAFWKQARDAMNA
jgi:DNA-binding transcriptional MerR regulator